MRVSGLISKSLSKSDMGKTSQKGYLYSRTLMLTMLKTLEWFLYWNYSFKDSTLEQELANCQAVFDISTNNKSLYFDLKKSRKNHKLVILYSDLVAMGNYILILVEYFKFYRKKKLLVLLWILSVSKTL